MLIQVKEILLLEKWKNYKVKTVTIIMNKVKYIITISRVYKIVFMKN